MITQKGLANFYHEFGVLINAGVSVHQTLYSIMNSTSNRQIRNIAAGVGSGIEQGKSLTEAMAAYPGIFSVLQLRIVGIGERTGKLAESLVRIGENLERNHRIRTKLITGFLYPVFLIHAVIIIPAAPKFFLEGVVPFLKQVAQAIVPLYAFGLLVILAVKVVNRVQHLKKISQYILNSVLIIGPLIKRLAIARFMWNLSALYSAGENVTESIRIAADSCGNIPLSSAILKTIPEIEQGGSLTNAFRKVRFFPGAVIEMLNAGEESGRMGDMLEKVAEYYEKEHDTIVKRLMIIAPLFLYMLVMLYIAYVVISFWLGYFKQIGNLFEGM